MFLKKIFSFFELVNVVFLSVLLILGVFLLSVFLHEGMHMAYDDEKKLDVFCFDFTKKSFAFVSDAVPKGEDDSKHFEIYFTQGVFFGFFSLLAILIFVFEVVSRKKSERSDLSENINNFCLF
jgi:hypothetical protein